MVFKLHKLFSQQVELPGLLSVSKGKYFSSERIIEVNGVWYIYTSYSVISKLWKQNPIPYQNKQIEY